ncbi:MAG: hypothetical protein ACRDY7_16555 [Acidimicrobiia bacterium]
MPRVRISTTVDAERLVEARRLVGGPDSRIIDRALAVLVDGLAAEAELAALAAAPYEGDPDLSWEAAPGPDLPYDGEVPPEVLRLAAQRRKERERR